MARVVVTAQVNPPVGAETWEFRATQNRFVSGRHHRQRIVSADACAKFLTVRTGRSDRGSQNQCAKFSV